MTSFSPNHTINKTQKSKKDLLVTPPISFRKSLGPEGQFSHDSMNHGSSFMPHDGTHAGVRK